MEKCQWTRVQKIAALNNICRTTMQRCHVMVTRSLMQLDPQSLRKVVAAVQSFGDFTEDNDPFGECNMGRVTVDGTQFIWKFDYYDNDLQFHSPDPTDERVTQRVLTIMQASEY